MCNCVVMGYPLLYGTTNQGKLEEVQALASQLGVTVEGLEGVDRSAHGDPPVVAEDSGFYGVNALHKAGAYAAWSGRACLADDTGIELEDLGGYPGVYSARIGVRALQERLLAGVSYRARFVCCMAYAEASGRRVTVTATLPGTFVAQRGDGVSTTGLEFSPYFIPHGETKSLHTLLRQGFCDSHRARALRSLLRAIR